MMSKRVSQSRLFFEGVLVIVLSSMMITPALAKGRSFRKGCNFHIHGGCFCSKTSQAAFKACYNEIMDDFWIAIGNCNNLSDPDACEECEAEAKEALKEGREECMAQYEARQDVCESLGESPYDPQINPADFVDPSEIGKSITPNPYFPLVAGRTYTYEGEDETITVTVTKNTKEILDVTCVVVRDVVEEEGVTIEDTEDWFAQDIHGNVWYFGEISKEFEDGEMVSLDGSWKAGVDGAKPGILMEAAPEVGDVYRQEFLLGDAEDMAEVLSVSGSAEVPATSCDGDCLITKDFTPLEPDVDENKYYAPGLGLILEVKPETGERVELVNVTAD